MRQLGKVLPCIIAAMAASTPENGPIFMAKWDIKDGFWRLVVHETDAWNFCYVLPGCKGDDIQIVVPTSLQMGWCESPPFFCAASETARDIAQELLANNQALPPHPLETLCMPPEGTFPTLTSTNQDKLKQLLEVYVDDFLGLIQAPSQTQALHFTRAILHGIHKVFAPSDNGAPDDEPIAIKKLNQGDGRWATTKEILGWVFDGIAKTMTLPTEKVNHILQDLHIITRQRTVSVKTLQRMQGRLMHATHGIPNGKALLSPLVALVAKHHHNQRAHVQLDQATMQSLRDWQAILKTSSANPTLCSDLVPAPPDYTGYCDASKMGAGGVWFGTNKQLPAIVWRISFPDDIQKQICSDSNPLGTLTNSDLEMAGLVCQWLVLECLADLQHCHVAVGCDNTPTVAWASRLLSSKAKTAAHLLRALAIRMLACQATPLTAYHIPGVLNTMADVASRSLVSQPSDHEFLTLFNARFPLEQDASWMLCTLSSKTIGKLYSTLRTTTSPLVWWQRTTRNASITGGTGKTSFGPLSTRIFKTHIQMKKFPSSKPLVNGPDKETLVAANKSKRVRFKMPSEQSERASN